jgi:TRAP-type C4-dicarboxylate transport system permease small subunit
MKRVWRILQWVIEALSSITGGIAALCIVAAAIIVTEGIITRKVFRLSAIWQIEASVFLLIFACFVGAAFAQKHEHHLNVDLILVYLSPKTREILLIIVSIITCVLVALLSWYAWPMWWEALIRNDHSMSLWGPPLWIPYVFLPLGMGLLFFQYIDYIVKKIASLRKGELFEEAKRFELKDIELSKTDSDRKQHSRIPDKEAPG